LKKKKKKEEKEEKVQSKEEETRKKLRERTCSQFARTLESIETRKKSNQSSICDWLSAASSYVRPKQLCSSK